jgi:hypothetical protein
MNALPMIVIGLVVAAALIAAVAWGIRLRSRRAAPPAPSEQPSYPSDAGHPPGELHATPESNELPPRDDRLTPHQLKDHGNER